MKKLFFAIIAIFIMTSCGNPRQNANTESSDSNKTNRIEVIYFHGKQRCITCNAIEKLTKEVLTNDFAKQLKDGTIVFNVVDISTADGEQIADKYEVSWSSLYINKWEDGKESKNNMTEFGFSCAKNSPDEFKAGIKNKIEELLK